VRPALAAVLFFPLDVTAQQRLDGFSSNVHKMTSLQRYSLMVVPHENPPPKKKWGLKTSISRAKIQTPPFSDGRCAETGRNSGKTKIFGIGQAGRAAAPPSAICNSPPSMASVCYDTAPSL